MVKKERKSNIELLRIFTIMGVIVLHYNNPMIGGGIAYAEEGSLNFYILYFLESLFVCGVNLFMLLSGYFLCDSKRRNLWRPIELIIQVVIFREAGYLLHVAMGSAAFSIKTMATTLLPANYFVIFYCIVFILSPYINVMIDHLSERAFRMMIIISLVIFAFYPTLVDVIGELCGSEFVGLSSIGVYGSQWGYTIVNFILMYLLGAYLKKGHSKIRNWTTGRLLTGLLICIVLMMIWARINDRVGFFTERSAWEYCNPIVIAETIIIFCLFQRINLGTNKIINKLAEGVFTVFLLHQVFIPYLRIETFVTGNPVLMVLHVIGCSVGIFLICWVAHMIYHLIVDPVFKLLSEKIKLPAIDAES